MRDEPTRERSTASLRVLVVDDSELFRTGLQALLLHEAFEVANAANGESALRQVLTFCPDVVVMDMGMPDMSGCEATRRILEVAPNTAVMMLTGSDGGDVLAAVRAGASGYVLKGAEVADIVKAIRATAAGHSPFAPQVTGAPRRPPRSQCASWTCSSCWPADATTTRLPIGSTSAAAR